MRREHTSTASASQGSRAYRSGRPTVGRCERVINHIEVTRLPPAARLDFMRQSSRRSTLTTPVAWLATALFIACGDS
ncbi:MAG: hypothetical protein JSV95_07085, partial [Gemmatimonadota bacterium]